jgi:ferredoxin
LKPRVFPACPRLVFQVPFALKSGETGFPGEPNVELIPGVEMATVTRVWLDETENECTMCGACEATCPEVFEVPEKMVVKPGADLSLDDQILESAEGCPVGTIAIEYDNSGKRDNPA